MFVYKEPTDDPVRNIEEDSHIKRASYITGDRMSTFMIYLSEVWNIIHNPIAEYHNIQSYDGDFILFNRSDLALVNYLNLSI